MGPEIKRDRESLILFFFALIGVGVATLLLRIGVLAGDFRLFLYHLYLNKIHLFHDFSIPYFTPATCGGFVLAADAQNLLFSIFQAFSLLMKNQFEAAQWGAVASSMIFLVGFFRYTRWFQFEHKVSRVLVSFLVVFSGFWIAHLKTGHLNFHGIAYLPWVFDRLEMCFRRSKTSHGTDLSDFLTLSTLLFLMVNSGPIWAQVSIPLFLGRVISQFVLVSKKKEQKRFLRGLGVFALASLFALLLSGPRITAMFEIAFSSFPREISVGGVFGGLRYLVVAVFRAFFDADIIRQGIAEEHVGGWWEWTAYLTIVALPLILIGIRQIKISNRCLLGLFIACVIQIGLTRGVWLVEIFRTVFPFLKGISWYYRGIIILTFFLSILAGYGLDQLISLRPHWNWRIGSIVVALCLVDFIGVYHKGGMIKPPVSLDQLVPYYYADWSIPNKIHSFSTEKKIRGISSGIGDLTCYNPPLMGYRNQYHRTQVREGSISAQQHRGTYNLNDVPTLFSKEAKGGRFKHQPWPLWPQSEKESFEQFIQFKQVHSLPLTVRVSKILSLIALLALFAGFGTLLWMKRKKLV